MKLRQTMLLMVWGSIFLLGSSCQHQIQYLTLPAVANPYAQAQADPADPLLAGFAKESITPPGPVWIAGFGTLRLSLGVHDDLWVRALVLKQGEVKLALVAADLLGLQEYDVLRIKARVPGFRSDQILIASTHTHSGPDTIGFWGFPPLFSGVSAKYMDQVAQAVAGAIQRAEAAAQPARVSTAVYAFDPTIMFNANLGEPKDDTIGVMAFADEKGGRVATLINLAGHAETRWANNHYLTADYPGRVCALSEAKFGGGAIFFNGALGAMITPNLPQSSKGRGWDTLERVSLQVFAEVERGMGLLQPETNPALRYRRSRLFVPIKNQNFIQAMRFGMLKRELYAGDLIATSVSVIELGAAQFVTFPGEAYPKQGLKIREKQKPESFQIGLADDELGYILYPPDYGTELYRYETSMCVGPDLAPMLEDALWQLLEPRPGAAAVKP